MREIRNFGVPFLISSLLTLSACRTFPPIYTPPGDASDLAPIKYEFSSGYPIVVGEVDISQGSFQCGQLIPTHERLFVRARGNPLLEDVNLGGTSLPVDKPVFLIATAIAGPGSFYCRTDGNFIPRAGRNYLVRLKYEQCSLEVLDAGAGEQVESEDFSPLQCGKSK